MADQIPPFSRDQAWDDLVKFLKDEIIDEGSFNAGSNLGRILQASSLGLQGAGRQLAEYMYSTYGVPVEESVKRDPFQMEVYDLIGIAASRQPSN